jgi:hypothetical protein
MSGTSFDVESVHVSIISCADSTDTIESGLTNSHGWFPLDITEYEEWTWYVVCVKKEGYITKLARTFLYDTLTEEIIPIEIRPVPICSTYTWSAYLLDKRTGAPLAGAVATITQLQTTWWCGDTLTPWGAGQSGAWTVTSTSDGLLTTQVLRDSIIRITIQAMSYDETIVMDQNKTSGKLWVSPSGGYRR